MTAKEKRGTTDRHLFGDAGDPIGAVDAGMSHFWRAAEIADAKFAEAMVAAGYSAEVKTGPQGNSPTFILPGLASPGVRSNADF